MDERRFCCGCGLCSSDGIPPLSQSFSRLGIVRTGFGSALGLSKRFSKISFFSEIPARSPYFSIFLSVFARSGRLSKEVLVTTSFRTGCVCPRRAGNVRSRRPCGRVPGRCAAVRNWPSAKANGAGRFMADSENNQDKLAFFHRFRRNPVRIAFFRLIFVPLADALDTPARQCSNKFDIALAYSYLCSPKST